MLLIFGLSLFAADILGKSRRSTTKTGDEIKWKQQCYMVDLANGGVYISRIRLTQTKPTANYSVYSETALISKLFTAEVLITKSNWCKFHYIFTDRYKIYRVLNQFRQ